MSSDMSYNPMFDEQTMPTILCCMCGRQIQANAANMCVQCIRSQVDITEGIPKQINIHWCRACGRYLQPPNIWIQAALESRELLSLCLKRVRGLQKVKLVDASFIWTEPHSKRIKVKLEIQKEVFSNTILQQSFIIEYHVHNQQCNKCEKFSADQTWNAVAQIRQKVNHKRTFLWLEQLIIKHNAQADCKNIKEFKDGLDFYFLNRNHAAKITEFISAVVPVRYKTSKELVSHDIKSNTYNYRFSISVEIAPICKDDLVCLPRATAKALGGINPLQLCLKVSGSIHLMDATTLNYTELNPAVFWRTPFRAVMDRSQLITFIILDVTPLGAKIGKFTLAEVEVARERDLGKNDKTFIVNTHLGHLLRAGDTALGFDLVGANFNDSDVKAMRGKQYPDVILVKKSYPNYRRKNRRRKWKLRALNKEVEEERKADVSKTEKDYEIFMRDLEEDPEMRSNINLYKADNISENTSESDTEDDEEFPKITYDELIDEFDSMNIEQ